MIEYFEYDLSEEDSCRTTYKYDQFHNMIEQTVYNEDGTVFEANSYYYKYEYDEYYNYIKRFTIRQQYNSIVSITERKIEYYE